MFKDKNILQSQKYFTTSEAPPFQKISSKGPLECLQKIKCQLIDSWILLNIFLMIRSAALLTSIMTELKE